MFRPCRTFFRALLDDVLSSGNVDGYRQLPLWQRKEVDLRLCGRALKTRRFWRWLLISCLWLLLAETAVMRLDLMGPERFWPGLSLLFVLIPVVAVARRRALQAYSVKD